VVIFAASKTFAGGALINTPSGWTQADQPASQVSSVTSAIFFKENASAGQTLPAITLASGTADCYAYAIEYAGVATASSLDVHTTGANTSSSATGTTGTTGTDSQVAELLVGVLSNPNVTTTTADAMGGSATGGSVAKLGEATSGNATAASRVTARSYEYIQTGTGTAEFHGSFSPSRGYAGVVATFKAVSNFPQAISTSETSAVTLSRGVGKPISISGTVTAALSRGVGRAISATTSLVAGLSRGVGKPISVQAPVTADAGLTKSLFRTVAVDVPISVVVGLSGYPKRLEQWVRKTPLEVYDHSEEEETWKRTDPLDEWDR
jgi:hypothetical protein